MMEDRIVNVLSQFPNMTYEELAKTLSVSRASIARTMKKMIDSNRVERSGSKKTGGWKILR